MHLQREAATSAADLLSSPSAWISGAPAGRISEGSFKVASGLSVVVWTLPTGTVVPPNRQSPESGVVHDHVRLSQHQIAAVA
jgi:hypothetical protein